jgi:hypothetical protein
MQVRQQSALRERAGQVRRILTSYGVHHEQIQHLNESLKVMYSQRGYRKPQSTQGCISVYREQSAISPGAQGTRTSRAHENGTDLPAWEGPKIPAMRCRQCGEQFPVLDFYYTKKTGLCIPCWEAKVK